MGSPTTAQPDWRSPPLDRVRNNIDLPWAFLSSACTGLRDRHRFDDLRTYCMFIGYPRSGHSLLGSLLDAHPEAMIAHEADALRYVQARFTRVQVYSLLLRNSQLYRERREIIYDYTVPRQWQGRARRIAVLGDKKGGRSTRRLSESAALLDRLRRVVGVPIRFVHVIRNPFDNITTISQRKPAGGDLDPAIAEYVRLCQTVERLKSRLGAGALLDVRHEALLADPRGVLRQVCGFLGIQPEADYLDDCSSILFDAPRQTRHLVEWSPDHVRQVTEVISRIDFLHGYSFED